MAVSPLHFAKVLAENVSQCDSFTESVVFALCILELRSLTFLPSLVNFYQNELAEQFKIGCGSLHMTEYTQTSWRTHNLILHDECTYGKVFDHLLVTCPAIVRQRIYYESKFAKWSTYLYIEELVNTEFNEANVEFAVHAMERQVYNRHKFEAGLIKILLNQAIPLFKELPNVQVITRFRPSSGCNDPLAERKDEFVGQPVGKVTVVGDLHGQFEDFMHILRDPKLGGFPSAQNQIVFNGDLVDRGEFSVEILVVLLCIKILIPDAVHIVRGNHESRSMNGTYGFHKYLTRDYGEGGGDRSGGVDAELIELFAELFNALPVAAVIDDMVFVAHGGVGIEVSRMTIEDINQLDRFQEPPLTGPIHELLWNGKYQEFKFLHFLFIMCIAFSI